MRRPRALTSLALAAGLAACAGGSSSTLGPLADQADRVAALVEQGEGCRAVEAVRSLQTMADGDVDPAVRDAVTRFTVAAQGDLVCDPGAATPSPDDAATPSPDGAATPPPTEAPADPPPADGEDAPGDGEEGRGRDQAPGQQDKDDEGQGRGQGNGQGNGGRGNDDD